MVVLHHCKWLYHTIENMSGFHLIYLNIMTGELELRYASVGGSDDDDCCLTLIYVNPNISNIIHRTFWKGTSDVK